MIWSKEPPHDSFSQTGRDAGREAGNAGVLDSITADGVRRRTHTTYKALFITV